MEMSLNKEFNEMTEMEMEQLTGGEIKWYDCVLNSLLPGYILLKTLAEDLNRCYTNSYNDVIVNAKSL